MSKKTQMFFWIIATIVGTAGVSIIARNFVMGFSTMHGIILLCIMAVLFVITWRGKAGRDKGDTA